MSMKCGWILNNRLIEIPAESVDLKYFDKLKEVLHIKKVDKYSFVRIGTPDKDGGYIMVDNFGKSNIAYSFGICDDINWDNDMANKGYEIFMYDHTIENLPYGNPKFHFFKSGISGIANQHKLLNTLEYYIYINEHENCKNMILKMDVEGYEWDFLSTVKEKTLKQFDQIVLELHQLLASNNNKPELLEKLNQTHQLIHIHPNNCSMALQIGEHILADTIEVTYINKDYYKTFDSEIILPIELDRPNDLTREDIILGSW